MQGSLKPSQVVVLPICILMLAGCAIKTRTVVIDTGCTSMQIIRYSKMDSDQTIRDVKAHNAVWRHLCENADE